MTTDPVAACPRPAGRTMPVSAAAVLLTGRVDLAALAASAVVRVGLRPEVDLAVLTGAGGCHADLAVVLASYWHRCERLWVDLRAGVPAGRYVMVRRTLLEATQKYTRSAKADLVDELAACQSIHPLAELVTGLTDPVPDQVTLTSMAAGFGGEVTRDDDSTLAVSLPVTGSLTWPAALGGVTWPGEVRRVVTVTAKHARWRDRRVRRLWRVRVDLDEVWADPGPDRAALPQTGTGS